MALVLDAAVLWIAAGLVSDSIVVDTFGWALAGALAAAAATLVFQIALGVNNDDTYSLRVIERMARRSGKQVHSDRPGIVFVEIDGLAYPVLQRALRDGHAPEMARWLAAGTHQLVEWETDLSSQTGASQAGILLGSNDDIPAFRWVEKETGTLMTCSAPGDCKEIERRRTNGSGLLVDGGDELRESPVRGRRGGDPHGEQDQSRTKSESRTGHSSPTGTTSPVPWRSSSVKSSSSFGPLPDSGGATCSRAVTGAERIRSCVRQCASSSATSSSSR